MFLPDPAIRHRALQLGLLNLLASRFRASLSKSSWLGLPDVFGNYLSVLRILCEQNAQTCQQVRADREFVLLLVHGKRYSQSYHLEIFHPNLDIRYGVACLLCALLFDTREPDASDCAPLSCKRAVKMQAEDKIVVPGYVLEHYYIYGSTSVQIAQDPVDYLTKFAERVFHGIENVEI